MLLIYNSSIRSLVICKYRDSNIFWGTISASKMREWSRVWNRYGLSCTIWRLIWQNKRRGILKKINLRNIAPFCFRILSAAINTFLRENIYRFQDVDMKWIKDTVPNILDFIWTIFFSSKKDALNELRENVQKHSKNLERAKKGEHIIYLIRIS